MSDDIRGVVEIHLDKPRKLKLDTWRVCQLEDQLGGPITKAELGFKDILVILRVAMGQPDMPLSDVAGLVEYAPGEVLGEKLTYLSEMIGKLVVATFGEKHLKNQREGVKV